MAASGVEPPAPLGRQTHRSDKAARPLSGCPPGPDSVFPTPGKGDAPACPLVPCPHFYWCSELLVLGSTIEHDMRVPETL